MSDSDHDSRSDRELDAEKGVRLAILGDVHLGEPPFFRLDQRVLTILRNADITIANQESPISDVAEPIGGKCCLLTASKGVDQLVDWGVNAVTLANNHIFDHGPAGFERTCELLDRAGIQHFGAGAALHDATRLCVIESKGLRIGLLGFASRMIQTTCATESSFGCAPLDESIALDRVRDAAARVDILIVLPHWGFCEYLFPRPEEFELGKRMLEAGAHAVIGHHPHVVQGAIFRDNRLLATSLGNFAFQPFFDRGGWVRPTRENRRGLFLVLNVDATGVRSFEPVFTHQSDDEITRDDDPARRRQWEARCKPLNATQYDRRWKAYVRRRAFSRILHYCNIRNWSRIRKETFIGAWLLFKNSVFGTRETRRS